MAEPRRERPEQGLFARLQQDLAQRERMAGLTPADLLDLSSAERRIVQVLARRGDLTLDALAEEARMSPADVAALTDQLEGKGFVRGVDLRGQRLYRTYFARKRGGRAPLDIWRKLGERAGADAERGGSG